MQKRASRVLESRQESTRRVAQFMTATRYRKPGCTGIYVMSALQTCMGRSVATPLSR